MLFTVKREHQDATTTVGKLYLGTIFIDATLERGPGVGKGPIPAGTYSLIVDHSQHFGKDLPHILNVPGFEGIRIHCGNTFKDTEGCILLGLATEGDTLEKSHKGFDAFMKRLQIALNQGPVQIEIQNNF